MRLVAKRLRAETTVAGPEQQRSETAAQRVLDDLRGGREPDASQFEHTYDDAEVRRFERRLLFPSDRTGIEHPKGVALALSGGGIRSAAFSLGALQALLEARVFERFDYLSTVSGGGYLGNAVTWLLHRLGRTSAAPFLQQFGDRVHGARSRQPQRNVWLDYIRQHSGYLTPGRMSDLGLAATVLRALLFNVAVYGSALVALMALAISSCVLPNPQECCAHLPATIESVVVLLALIGAGSILLYAVATWLASLRNLWAVMAGFVLLSAIAWLLRLEWGAESAFAPMGTPRLDLYWPVLGATIFLLFLTFVRWLTLLLETCSVPGPWLRRSSHRWQYRARVQYQSYLGAEVGCLIAALLLWSLFYSWTWLNKGMGVVASASLSSIIGAAGAVFQFFEGRGKTANRSALSGFRIVVTVLLLIYGLLLLSYNFGLLLGDSNDQKWAVLVLGTAIVLGFFVNTNYFGLSRMYRDRIMEAFEPNLSTIDNSEWAAATEADEARLVDFRRFPSNTLQRPLHLINCNVVLVDAKSDKYRGRGGDSFVLSPWIGGSNATGWLPTELIGDGTLTLASAIAASGAAVNPDSGAAGRGITRNRMVSFLLSFLNVRLGYWLPNPAARRWLGASFWPNLWVPGIRQGLMGRGLKESAHFVEITDGGHFDNTALYELIRRRVRVIVLCEGGQDSDYQMEDLANAIERVRTDFGVHIRFECQRYPLSEIRPPRKPANSLRGFAVGRIVYPLADGSTQDGALLYLQLSPIKDMPPDTDSYWRRHSDFPNQSTMDQFFDEEQIEAYRELGLEIAEQAFEALAAKPEPEDGSLKMLKDALLS
jgi:hypothetical protein